MSVIFNGFWSQKYSKIINAIENYINYLKKKNKNKPVVELEREEYVVKVIVDVEGTLNNIENKINGIDIYIKIN